LKLLKLFHGIHQRYFHLIKWLLFISSSIIGKLYGGAAAAAAVMQYKLLISCY